jgi:hypothetical protein
VNDSNSKLPENFEQNLINYDNIAEILLHLSTRFRDVTIVRRMLIEEKEKAIFSKKELKPKELKPEEIFIWKREREVSIRVARRRIFGKIETQEIELEKSSNLGQWILTDSIKYRTEMGGCEHMYDEIELDNMQKEMKKI